jgi:hypothetical protein
MQQGLAGRMPLPARYKLRLALRPDRLHFFDAASEAAI